MGVDSPTASLEGRQEECMALVLHFLPTVHTHARTHVHTHARMNTYPPTHMK